MVLLVFVACQLLSSGSNRDDFTELFRASGEEREALAVILRLDVS